jgi:hypothetical protein
MGPDNPSTVAPYLVVETLIMTSPKDNFKQKGIDRKRTKIYQFRCVPWVLTKVCLFLHIFLQDKEGL